MSELATVDPSAIIAAETYKGWFKEMGCVVPQDAQFQDIADALTAFRSMDNTTRWIIGDLVADAERRFSDVLFQALPEGEEGAKLFYAYGWVASKVPMKNRRPELSMAHHRVVAKLDLDQQKHWLAKAVEHGWSRDEFNTIIKGEKEKAIPKPPPTAEPVVIDGKPAQIGVATVVAEGDPAPIETHEDVQPMGVSNDNEGFRFSVTTPVGKLAVGSVPSRKMAQDLEAELVKVVDAWYRKNI